MSCFHYFSARWMKGCEEADVKNETSVSKAQSNLYRYMKNRKNQPPCARTVQFLHGLGSGISNLPKKGRFDILFASSLLQQPSLSQGLHLTLLPCACRRRFCPPRAYLFGVPDRLRKYRRMKGWVCSRRDEDAKGGGNKLV